jgi:hypothetical protein
MKPGGAQSFGGLFMRVRGRELFRAALVRQQPLAGMATAVLGGEARANTRGTGPVPGGTGFIAPVLLALALTACGGVPSPRPTGTSPTSAPIPTSTAWACVTSSPTGTCPRNGAYATGSTNSNGYNTYLANNCWADPACHQTLSANGIGDWQVTANEPAGNGSVKTAPEAQQQMNNWCAAAGTWENVDPGGCGNSPLSDTPISAMSRLTSTYAEAMAHNPQTIAQWAWDNWLGNDTGYPSEVMVWTDNNGRCNSGSLGTRVHAPVTIAGQEWTPYQYGSTEFIWSLDGPGTGTCAQQASGTVDLLALLKWMQANGHAAAGATLRLVDGVFEICSTGGVPETFRVTSYSVTGAGS